METANEMAKRLMDEIGDGKKASYHKGEVKTILNSISQAGLGVHANTPPVADFDGKCRGPIEATEVRRGDVFIHKLVGGKVRPWIVLFTDGDVVTAVSMSSGDKAPNMIQSQCRLWPSTWIGTTVTQVSMPLAVKEVTRPYTNVAHLRVIEDHVAECIGMRIQRPTPTLSVIANRMAGGA